MQSNPVRAFESHWQFARELSRDLLLCLEDDDLLFSPGDRLGPLWKQFRHLGRIQENYLQATETGRIVFGYEGGTYRGGSSKQQLLDYLDRLDQDLAAKLRRLNGDMRIEWPDGAVDLPEHLTYMLQHEILHHGMFVVSMQLLGRRYPESWRAWGL